MQASTFCFFCGTGRADREYDHRILGLRPCCAACEPSNISNASGDTLTRMTGVLVAAAQGTALDLVDEREVDEQLRANGYGDDEIALFMVRAVEAARRQIQQVAARFRPFVAHAVEGAALSVMLTGMVALYTVLNPPEPAHRHAAYLHAAR